MLIKIIETPERNDDYIDRNVSDLTVTVRSLKSEIYRERGGDKRKHQTHIYACTCKRTFVAPFC